MTNKIHLSFNRLYMLKDGDYHGATLTYRIKHGDDLLAEGEIKGKSLSQFIHPVDIEEMELTKPLSVEYVCTGNVEDIAVSDDRAFRVVDGGFYIKDFFIRDGAITNANLNLAEDAHLIGVKVPKIGDHLPDAKQREKVKEIVSRYLTGEASEYSQEMIDELMLIVAPDLDSRTLADCKKRFADSVPLPFGCFPGAKECQSKAAKPELPEIMCANSAPFSVTISWEGSKNISDGSKIQVQWIKDDYFLSTTDHKVADGEDSHTITGLKAGEEIHCRLRVVSTSGQKSEWSEFIKESASTDAIEMLNAINVTYSAGINIGVRPGASDQREMKSPSELTEKIVAVLKEQLRPGGILWGR